MGCGVLGAGKCQRVKGGVLCGMIPCILPILTKLVNRTALVKCRMRTHNNNLVIHSIDAMYIANSRLAMQIDVFLYASPDDLANKSP